MKLILNPKYEHLRGYLMDIDDNFEKDGEIIHQGRNRIAVCRTDGLELNIKRYAPLSFFKSLIYSFFRKPKGLRAYLYPQVLIEKGFDSPEPVAYIERRRFGLVTESYFVSRQCGYSRRLYEFSDKNMDDAEMEDILREFVRFTARLHESGVMHLDYSPGNVLFDRVDGEWRFSLVDTNRMYFGKVSVEEGCRNFARLWGQPDMFRFIAREYAAARGADPAQCLKWVMDARNKFWRRFSRRHKVKYNLKFE